MIYCKNYQTKYSINSPPTNLKTGLACVVVVPRKWLPTHPYPHEPISFHIFKPGIQLPHSQNFHDSPLVLCNHLHFSLLGNYPSLMVCGYTRMYLCPIHVDSRPQFLAHNVHFSLSRHCPETQTRTFRLGGWESGAILPTVSDRTTHTLMIKAVAHVLYMQSNSLLL